MALVVGTNSWVSVDEADAYFETRAGSLPWFSFPSAPPSPGEDSKETFLITAFYWLIDDTGFGLSAGLENDFIDRAQMEAALFLMNYREEYESRQAKIAGGVERFKNSKWEEDLSKVEKPQNILDLVGKAGYSVQNGVVQLLPEDYE